MFKTGLFLFQATEDKIKAAVTRSHSLQCCIGNSKLVASIAILILTDTLSWIITYHTGNYP